MGALNDRGFYSLTILVAKSPKSRCWHGCTPSRVSWGESFLPLPVSGGSRYSLTCGSITPVSASCVHIASFHLFLLQTLLSLMKTSVTGFSMCACVFSHVQLFATPVTVARQALLSVGFPWRSCPFLLQGIFLTQGSNPRLLNLPHWQAACLPLFHLGSPHWV